jgi:hypothetical protein
VPFRSGKWRMLIALPAFAAVAYLGVCVWFAAHQRELLYTPGGVQMTPTELGCRG